MKNLTKPFSIMFVFTLALTIFACDRLDGTDSLEGAAAKSDCDASNPSLTCPVPEENCGPMDVKLSEEVACFRAESLGFYWDGQKCEELFGCLCEGADCDDLYATSQECAQANEYCHEECSPVICGMYCPYGYKADETECDICECNEEPNDSMGYLLWQAPGGFVGMGAAVEMFGDGTVRLWEQTSQMTPHQTTDWNKEIFVDEIEILKVFVSLVAVDYTKLPHENQGWECYPTLHFQSCQHCRVIEINYHEAVDLLPEMEKVYDWFDSVLGKHSQNLPGQYCLLE